MFFIIIEGPSINQHKQKSGFLDHPLPHVPGLSNRISLKITLGVRTFWVFLKPPPGKPDVLYGWSLRVLGFLFSSTEVILISSQNCFLALANKVNNSYLHNSRRG